MKNPYSKRTLWRLSIIAPIIVYLAIACTVQRFKCPRLTEMQLFLRLPEIVKLDFVQCDE